MHSIITSVVRRHVVTWQTLSLPLLFALGCGDGTALQGPQGLPGAAGKDGAPGMQGPPGMAGADGNGAAEAGSRLKPQYFIGADGSKQFATMIDTKTNEPCSFSVATDGVLRCLPASPSKAPFPIVFYTDAGCSVAVYMLADIADTGMPSPPLVYVSTKDAGKVVYVSIGNSVPDPLPIYEKFSDGTCGIEVSPDPPRWWFWSATILDPGWFVAATLTN